MITPAILVRLSVAALGGAAIGLERQWSGHASGPEARFAGVRTFTMVGAVSGICGWLWTLEHYAVAAVLLAGVLALIVAAYVRASVIDVDGTTEVAAIVTAAAGLLAGLGELRLASGIIALTTLLLVEKTRLHAWIARVDEPGLRAGVRFAVMAMVVLPLLPAGPVGPLGGVRPRELWALVLFFSGLSFAGYVARRTVGAGHGYPVSGLLGGLISSTSVTLTFARLSRAAGAPQRALATGALASSTVLLVRVLFACAVLNPVLARGLAPVFLPAFLAGAVAVAAGMRNSGTTGAADQPPGNPLQFRAAVQMALLFQAVLFGTHLVQDWFGRGGLLVTGALLGLTDVDALTLSMAREAVERTPIAVAAQALGLGILSNTLMKLAMAAAIGSGAFRTMTAAGLGLIAAALAAALWLLLG
ncbi:MAG TPA: MgtC/SapB family protein [Methylomirabilota bacterium]